MTSMLDRALCICRSEVPVPMTMKSVTWLSSRTSRTITSSHLSSESDWAAARAKDRVMAGSVVLVAGKVSWFRSSVRAGLGMGEGYSPGPAPSGGPQRSGDAAGLGRKGTGLRAGLPGPNLAFMAGLARVDAVIATYNAPPARLAEAIGSCLASPLVGRVIVVDDGSEPPASLGTTGEEGGRVVL